MPNDDLCDLPSPLQRDGATGRILEGRYQIDELDAVRGEHIIERIGHDSIVGANAVVTKDVPPHSLVAGIPAKVVRTLEGKPLLTHVETKA